MSESIHACRDITDEMERATVAAAKQIIEALRPMCATYGAAQTELNKLIREARFSKRDIAQMVLSHALGILEIEKMRQPFVPPEGGQAK